MVSFWKSTSLSFVVTVCTGALSFPVHVEAQSRAVGLKMMMRGGVVVSGRQEMMLTRRMLW